VRIINHETLDVPFFKCYDSHVQLELCICGHKKDPDHAEHSYIQGNQRGIEVRCNECYPPCYLFVSAPVDLPRVNRLDVFPGSSDARGATRMVQAGVNRGKSR
jgi:hypothetical protein